MISYVRQYVGDKEFYQKTFRIAIPLALQVLLQGCMNIVDMMMVSSIGMVTAVGNTAQILILHDGISWGIIAGISMFASQFFGGKQETNLQKTFVLGLILGSTNALLWTLVALFFGETLLYFYLPDLEILKYSMIYLRIMLFYLIPFAVNNSFMTMYRSTHQTKVTLCISILGASTNVLLNYIFIFGLRLGIAGAAYGTVLAQLVTLTANISYAKYTKQIFIQNFRKSIKIDFHFVKPILVKMFPLIVNETFFGFGMSLFVKAFGMLGTQGMNAYYVANQIYNLFLFAINGYGSAVSILVGARLGSGNIQLAKEESKYQVGLGFVIGLVMVGAILVFAKPLVFLFGYSEGPIYTMAIGMLSAFAVKVLLRMFNFMMFSTLRAGGDTKVLNFLDSGIMYGVGLTLAFGSVMVLGIDNIVTVVWICQLEQFVRFIFTALRYRKFIWAKDLTKLVAE